MRRRMTVLAAITTLLLLAAACGGDGGALSESDLIKIRNFDRVLTIEDLKAIGFKDNKQYNVEGLPDAADAWKGFWGLDIYDRHDYELRFYPSHQVAVDSGSAMAEEATGDEFEQTRDSQTWTAGVRDRWKARGVTDVSSGGSRQAPGPAFADWVIFGNVVMLCEGLDEMQALERCEQLGDALAAPAG